MPIVKKIHDYFTSHHNTLVLAESCTGGMLAHLITSLAGASNFFLGSFVVYSNDLKEKVLGVKPQTLKTFGAVSKETVLEMCKGALAITHADFAIAVTGYAEPEDGVIWAAIGERGKEVTIFSLNLKGDRTQIISACSYTLLEKLYGICTSG